MSESTSKTLVDLDQSTNKIVSQEDIYSLIVDRLAQKEILRRASLLQEGFRLLKEAQLELQKVRPDNKIYSQDGKLITDGYSEKAIAHQRKSQEKVGRIEKALEGAIQDPAGLKYRDLEKIINK